MEIAAANEKLQAERVNTLFHGHAVSDARGPPGSNMLLRLHQIDKFYPTGEGPLHVLRGIDLSLQGWTRRPTPPRQ